MSREVLGSATDDVVAEPEPGPRGHARGVVGLDDEAARRDPVGQAPPSGPRRSVHGAVSTASTWTRGRLDLLRASRTRTVAALGVVALVSGLLAAGVGELARQARLDAAPGVVAWLDHVDSGVGGTGQAALELNVVNTGGDSVTVVAADLEGGLEGTSSGVALELPDRLTVPASGHASGPVAAKVADCTSASVARGGTRDGTLRVTVAGADLRDAVLDGTRVGAFPVSASTVVELGCGGDLEPTVLVEGTTVRADGRLHITLRGFGADVEVEGLSAPDGVALVTDPASPVVVPGGERSPTVTIAVALEVRTCTVSAQQLDAGDQVQLEVDGRRLDVLDHVIVNAWVVREVERACS